ncbi:MAG TPA: hypothetical protein DEB25_05580 [Desulfobulbaceae bacterium]|nr:hypothetical protein [Desulfobulbaceae bacterium]
MVAIPSQLLAADSSFTGFSRGDEKLCIRAKMTERFELSFPLPPWLRDHHFAGQAVLPMVMAIDFLAALVLKKFPEIHATRLEEAIFPKLLILPEGDALSVLVELEWLDEKRLRAVLLTRKSGAISRLLRHAEVLFTSKKKAPREEPPPPLLKEAPKPGRVINCERIYAELVPFGSNFRTLNNKLYFQGNTASGTLIVPDLPFFCLALPHPFLLDGAMHAACVHGQSFCGFVPFPVAFAAMEWENAKFLKKPGHVYETECILTGKDNGELRYDLRVWGNGGIIHVSGLMMRDVSGGAIKPPGWICENEAQYGKN